MPGPLEGIRVLDFTIAQQGPYATLLLADMGAEVIKLEGRERGEVGRLLGIDRRTGFSAYFLAINRGKKSLKLDLKCDRGREVALRLGRDCDVVAHNFRPGVMERLGLGYEAFRAVNPRVIYAGASAFGTKGPLGRKPGNDILAQAMSGLMSVTGDGEAPLPAGCAIADHIAGVTFALGIVSALFARERTGKGQEIECSLLASLMAAQSWEMTYFAMIGENPPKAGRGHTSLAWQWWTYRTADGWLAIGGVDPARWPGFCRAIGRPELVTDERFDDAGKRIRERHALNDVVEEHLRTRKTEEWLPPLEAEDIFCAPVLDYQQVLAHEQVRANGYSAEIDHPRAGGTTVIPTPIAFSETPVDSTRPEPLHGEHTEGVLREFGFDGGEIEELRQARVV
ncbi:MAG TPA: CoA transferase [Dehalococcoidia bacterium]|jgi:crotonobetainyl-CoA:carnitine CoA-transferase CaiB-like acyl-CoA transferase|nr:CoA transferase [Dehalococcoidia bacterium]